MSYAGIFSARGSSSAGVFFCILLLLTAPLPAQFPPPASHPAQPAPSEKRDSEFQPGVTIDWQNRSVRVRGRVVQTAGPLEFLACFEGKDHESIVRMLAAAEHVYMALGLCGNTPGSPARWIEDENRYAAPTGDLVDVHVEWRAADGTARSTDGFDWLVEVATEQRPPSRPWLFTGSIRMEDGGLAAGRSGAGVALVDMPDSLLALSRSYTSSDPELWAVADTSEIPPAGTEVVVVLRPAQPRRTEVSIDFRGDIRINGRWGTPGDAADQLALAAQLDPERVFVIHTDGTLAADRDRFARVLESVGVPLSRIRFTTEHRPAASSMPAETTASQGGR